MKIEIEGFESDFKKIEDKLKKISHCEDPEFARYIPAINFFKDALKPYMKYKKIIIIGHGGSITSTQGFYGALKKEKKLFVVDNPEPDYLAEIKQKAHKKETIVVVVSKSGTNVDILEIMMAFLNYKIIVVTNPESGALLEVSKKLGLEMIEHPAIGGRYSGFTSSTLVPCHLLGFDIEMLCKGANEMYKKCSPLAGIKDNLALEIASNLYMAEKKGYSETFMPIYSKKMDRFANLIIQLMHESSSKEGKGQTFYSASAPESQHHTNQRFFGGKKNVLGFFIRTESSVEKTDPEIKIPEKLKDIVLRNGSLADLNGNSYSQVLFFEYKGVIEHAKRNNIPRITLSIEKGDERELGQFVALWQYIAVYASLLREVNPFDQPEVEFSKKVSFDLRMKAAKKRKS